jgi:hypothetical protein
MKKSLLFTLILFSLLQFNKAQQIGNGWATVINDFTALLNSGTYSAADPIGSNPVGSWQHLFVIRHPNPNNNYQFQLSSSLWQDDRLFFRKLSFGDLSSGNQPWYELATRGSNTFNGSQTINGEIVWPLAQKNFTAAPREGVTPMSIRLWDNYNGGGPTSYGSLLEIYGRDSHMVSQLYFGGWDNSRIRYRQAFYADTKWNDWLFLLDSKNDVESSGNLKITGTGNHYLSGGTLSIGTTDPAGSTLKIYRDVLPTLELADNTVKFKVLIAKNTWEGAPYSQPGDVIMKSEGRQHGLILHMNDNNNDGNSYVRIGDNAHPNTINVTNKGFVGIGTFTPEFKLDVLGTIRAWGLKINNKKTADFVFAKDYKLPSLSEVETFVNKNNHLPGIASASEMEKNGVEIGEFQITLLQKIEELTLYSIQLKKENETQAKANTDLQQQLLDMKKELELIKKLLNEKR